MNSVTTELIEDKTPRAKAAAQHWKRESSKYAPSEIPWRHLQFLVEQTSIFDHTVSPNADILEISKSGKVTWLVKNACQ